jgi:hypothetical protein
MLTDWEKGAWDKFIQDTEGVRDDIQPDLYWNPTEMDYSVADLNGQQNMTTDDFYSGFWPPNVSGSTGF